MVELNGFIVDGIRAILMAHHTAGVCLPSAAKGAEREVLVREFLAEVFPPPFRFGSGAIVDAVGAMSGQLDIVVEFPFLPSFPTPGAPERLYLAESAALVIEVKSDLNAKWEQVRETAKKVLTLRRNWRAHEAFDSKGNHATFPATTSRIPFLAVGYRGPATGEALKHKLEGALENERPDGILVIESGAYSGCSLCSSTACASGAGGLLAFANDVAWLVRNVTWAAPKIGPYLNVVAEAG
jgi:hypothetical protein